jgi:hypothetical protein
LIAGRLLHCAHTHIAGRAAGLIGRSCWAESSIRTDKL